MNQRHLQTKHKHTSQSTILLTYVTQQSNVSFAIHNVTCIPNLLFDVFELLILLWLCEVWVMGQQVDHVRNDILRQERDEFFWMRSKNGTFRYLEYGDVEDNRSLLVASVRLVLKHLASK